MTTDERRERYARIIEPELDHFLENATWAKCRAMAAIAYDKADALIASDPAPPGEGWKTIDSAPLTSLSRLVWCPDRMNIYVVSWRDNGHDAPGWVHFGGLGQRLLEEPTHWMPLPKPPTPSEKGGTEPLGDPAVTS